MVVFDGMVAAGIAVFVVLLTIGVGFHRAQYERIAALRASKEEPSDVLQRLVSRSFAAIWIEVTLLGLALWLMVAKPG